MKHHQENKQNPVKNHGKALNVPSQPILFWLWYFLISKKFVPTLLSWQCPQVLSLYISIARWIFLQNLTTKTYQLINQWPRHYCYLLTSRRGRRRRWKILHIPLLYFTPYNHWCTFFLQYCFHQFMVTRGTRAAGSNSIDQPFMRSQVIRK